MTKQEQIAQLEAKIAALDTQITLCNNKQMALKINLNSCYGALGNAYFRFFDIKLAEGVTLTGQAIIQYAERVMNEHLNKFLKTDGIDRVIAIDTDSLYICVDDIVKRFNPKDPVAFLDQFGKKSIEPMLEKAFAEFALKQGAVDVRIKMGREVIADRAIWTAKKRYILNVLDSEGVRFATPKVKMMGIEAVKSSTPQVCRTEMKDIFPLIMSTDERTVQNRISEFKKKFFTLSPHAIAFPRSVSDIRSYESKTSIYVKGTPMHCRAAIMYNHMLNTKRLANKYRVIHNGDKIKFIYLRSTNPTRENVIAFPNDHLPVELGVSEYIDYETQFQKAYLDPIQIVLDAIGWNAEPSANLELFFG